MKIPLKQKAYDYVLDKIIGGELKPGERLSEVAMSKDIGISPTPLREAYRQLASEGFVKHVPNSGIYVRELEDSEIMELYEAREALETFAAGKAALRMNTMDLEELKNCLAIQRSLAEELAASEGLKLKPEQEARYMKADARFHMIILNAAENSVIMKTMRECHIMGRLLSFRSHEHNLEQVSNTIRQHTSIMEAVRDHNTEEAESRMREHIRFSCRTAFENRGKQAKEDLSQANPAGQDLNRFVYRIESKLTDK